MVRPEILAESIDEVTKEPSVRVRLKFQHGGIINKNKRRYRTELLQREIDRIQDALAEGEVYGAAYHPVEDAEMPDVSHIWHKAWMEKDGSAIGEATILPTPNGKIAMTIMRHGKIGLSSRGFGTVTRKTEKINGKNVTFDDVNEDFEMVTPGDFVLSASVPGAGILSIIESQFRNVGYSEDNKESLNMDYENIDAMEKDYPDLFTQYKKGLRAAVEKELSGTVEAQIADAKASWMKEMEEKVDAKVDAITEANNGLVEGIRKACNALSDLPGVIPESTDNDKGKNKEVDTKGTETEGLKKEVSGLTTTVAELTAKLEAKELKEVSESIAKGVRVKVVEELDKPEFKVYKTMLEKRLLNEDGTVKIEIKSVDAVPEAVKDVFTDISATIAEAQKNKIIGTGLDEKGRIGNPDLTEAAKKAAGLKAKYEQYLQGAAPGRKKLTFEEFKSRAVL